MSTVIIIAAAALLAFAVYSTVRKLRGKSGSSCCGTRETVLSRAVEDTDKSHYPYSYKVNIEGMMCSNCAARVENAINAAGYTWAHVNLGRGRAEVLAKKEMTAADFTELLKNTDYKVTGMSSVPV